MVGRFCGKLKVGESKEGVERLRTLQCFNLQVGCVPRLRAGGLGVGGYFEVQNHGHNAAAARRLFSRKQ